MSAVLVSHTITRGKVVLRHLSYAAFLILLGTSQLTAPSIPNMAKAFPSLPANQKLQKAKFYTATSGGLDPVL